LFEIFRRLQFGCLAVLNHHLRFKHGESNVQATIYYWPQLRQMLIGFNVISQQTSFLLNIPPHLIRVAAPP